MFLSPAVRNPTSLRTLIAITNSHGEIHKYSTLSLGLNEQDKFNNNNNNINKRKQNKIFSVIVLDFGLALALHYCWHLVLNRMPTEEEEAWLQVNTSWESSRFSYLSVQRIEGTVRRDTSQKLVYLSLRMPQVQITKIPHRIICRAEIGDAFSG